MRTVDGAGTVAGWAARRLLSASQGRRCGQHPPATLELPAGSGHVEGAFGGPAPDGHQKHATGPTSAGGAIAPRT